jgi:hypothetical protein
MTNEKKWFENGYKFQKLSCNDCWHNACIMWYNVSSVMN